jgi:PadR family transcriptional regulator, regulatory protein AphA
MIYRYKLRNVVMSSDELSLFSYEILGLVGRGGAGPHDLLRMSQRGRILNWAGESQYYAEPKRLAKLGYLAAHKERGKTRERTVYTLTDKGLAALESWAAEPASFTPVKSEPLVRMLIADLVGDEATRESLSALRAEIDDLYERMAESEATAARLPHRRKYLLLSMQFLHGLLDLYVAWIDDVERELAPSSPRASG